MVRLRQGEAGHCGAGAVGEKAHRGVFAEAIERGNMLQVGNFQRRNDPLDLARDAQPGAAGGQDPDSRAVGQDTRRELSAYPDEVLAVVEYQQQVTIVELLDQRIGQRSGRCLTDTQCQGCGLNEALRIRAGGELDHSGPGASYRPRRGRSA